MKTWFISDTHGWHYNLEVPKGIDLLIFAGDASNWRDPYRNEAEMLDFITWIEGLDIPNKVWIAGNHDTSIEKKLIRPKEICKSSIYLEHESLEILGLKLFGSPYTKEFGVGWAFNVKPHKLFDLWSGIPQDTDILITHGPPFGILDLSYDRDGKLENCGDKSLLKHMYRVRPKIKVFGHIHNMSDLLNQGTRTVNGLETIFVNASVLKDRHFEEGPQNHGIVLEI